METAASLNTVLFQSTPPVWGATKAASRITSRPVISIHAPRVGGDLIHSPIKHQDSISIHAPRVGGDDYQDWVGIGMGLFQSTPPVWGAT